MEARLIREALQEICGNTCVLLADRSLSVLQLMGLLCQTLAHTSKGVEAEAVAQTSSHAEPGKQEPSAMILQPNYINVFFNHV